MPPDDGRHVLGHLPDLLLRPQGVVVVEHFVDEGVEVTLGSQALTDFDVPIRPTKPELA